MGLDDLIPPFVFAEPAVKEVMNRQERAEVVAGELNRLYPAPEVPLHHRDTYTLLIAVLLSAQCTDIRVNLVTPALFALADTPKKMAEQSPERVQEIIRPCGLSGRKAANIVALSAILDEQYEGEVPRTFEELESLPGVGHKTASVVMSVAFGVPAFPVDTHVYRLARKWGLSKGSNVEMVERDLKKIFQKSTWGDLHLKMVLYGREYCPARGCRDNCSICSKLGIRATQ